MADEAVVKRRSWLSLDGWAVLLAIGLAVLVKFGILQHVPW